jgi:diguanylate cyclase (GGDEF)-like protein
MGMAPRGGLLAPVARPGDDHGARLEAYVAAYELVVLHQNECQTERITSLLEQAHERDWPEVACMLHYAELARVMPAGGATSEHLEAMFATAEAAHDPALLSLCLATQAEAAGYDPIAGDGHEGTLARAVAILDDVPGPAVERTNAYIACGLAYQARALWELEEEMYVRAEQDLAGGLAEPFTRLQDLCLTVLLINRLEARLAGACALFEIGEREAASRHAKESGAPDDAQLRRLPPQFGRDVAAVRYLLSAIAGESEDEPFESAIEAVHEPVWPGYQACVMLGLAVRRLDGGDAAAAAHLAEQSLPYLEGTYLPTVRTLALSLTALGDASSSAGRYATELARLRWRARLRLLASSRARLEAERAMTENERLARHAYLDELTGLANRRAYSRQLTRLQRGRGDHEVAVLMIDIDRFKQVNDRYGHTAGDDVLRRMGALLLERAGAGDLVARLGGDEFVIVLDEIGPVEAEARGRDLVRSVAAQPWRSVADGLAVTVSVGLSCGPAHQLHDLLAAADENLYRAKSAGRCRAVGDRMGDRNGGQAWRSASNPRNW